MANRGRPSPVEPIAAGPVPVLDATVVPDVTAIFAQIVSLTAGWEEADAALARRLEVVGVLVSYRAMGIRVSVHLPNTVEEVGRLLKVV